MTKPTSNEQPLIKACITQRFEEKSGETTALFNRLALEVFPGDVIGVAGKSGCGKSTLFKILGGLMAPTCGYVAWKDELVYSLDCQGCLDTGSDHCQTCLEFQKNQKVMNRAAIDRQRGRQISFVFQSHNLIPHFTVKENVALGLVVNGNGSEKENKQKIDFYLDMVGLSDQKSQKAEKLSGGQKQRVNFARAFAAEPSLILADEPFSHLDDKNTEEIWTGLCNYKQEHPNLSIIMISHDRDIFRESGPYKSDPPMLTHWSHLDENGFHQSPILRYDQADPRSSVSGNCPRCHTGSPPYSSTSMFEQIGIGPVRVDQCTKCGGIWFDKNELPQLWHHTEEFIEKVVEENVLDVFK